jgi:hypothetical protein
MKKILMPVICLLAFGVANKLHAGGAIDVQSYGVEVSTIQFSSSAFKAFEGPGLIYGVGCSSSSVFSTWTIFDSTFAPTNGPGGGNVQNTDKVWKASNFNNQYSTSGVAAGDLWFPVPLRVQRGAWFSFDDATANLSRLYYYAIQQGSR